jgi:DNA-binding NarL/FixJ family response regulator
VALRCVLVDDSPGFLAAGRRLLERQGISVVGVASTNAEAVRKVEELRPDLTLSDIDLGEESGFDLARELARSPNHSSPVILISAHLEDDFADLIRASPALGFVSKTDLSAQAIRDILSRSADQDSG